MKYKKRLIEIYEIKIYAINLYVITIYEKQHVK